MSACVICQRHTTGFLLCDACGRSYDRAMAHDDETIAAVIKWAARRARRIERSRREQAARKARAT